MGVSFDGKRPLDAACEAAVVVLLAADVLEGRCTVNGVAIDGL